MKDRLHLSRQKNTVLMTHPSEDGWAVYEYSDGLYHQLYLCYLLDYLQVRSPSAIRKWVVVNEIAGSDLMARLKESHPGEAGPLEDNKRLLSEGWAGQWK